MANTKKNVKKSAPVPKKVNQGIYGLNASKSKVKKFKPGSELVGTVK
jgi:hypothetical protein